MLIDKPCGRDTQEVIKMVKGVEFLMSLEISHLTLANVRFIDILIVFMAVDIIFGISVAVKCKKNLWSRKSLFGYARKMLVLVIIVVANVLDVMLQMEGVLVYGTVIFYIFNELLSIAENAAMLNIAIPKILYDSLYLLGKKAEASGESFKDNVKNELLGADVDKKLKEAEKKDEL